MLFHLLAIGLKVLLTAFLVVGSSLAAERMRPTWGGIIATIPLSSGAAYVMLAMTESAAFLADSALSSLVTSIAAFAYLAIFVRLAPRYPWHVSVTFAFLLWLGLSVAFHALPWNAATAVLGNAAAFLLCRYLTRDRLMHAGQPVAVPLRRRDLIVRGLAVGLLATIVAVGGRYVGPAVAGTLAVFPIVYVTVALIVQRRLGGAVAAATMAAAVTPLVGVGLAFLTIHLAAPVFGSLPALLGALAVSIAWPLMLAFHQIRTTEAATA